MKVEQGIETPLSTNHLKKAACRPIDGTSTNKSSAT